MTAPLTDANVYTDVKGLNSLKQAAKTQDPKAVREAARQFESLFTRMMLKSMREANFKDPNFGSDQQDFYQGMFDDQLAVEMSKGHGLGLADMLVQQLTRAGLVAPQTAAKQGAGAGATAGAGGRTSTAAVDAAAGATSIAAAAAAGLTAPGSGSGTPTVTTSASGTTTTFDSDSATAASGSDTPVATGGDAAVPTAAAAADSSMSTPQTDFLKAIWPAAQAAGQALGVDPRNIVAQAALETGWGRAVPADSAGRTSFNLFGIKTGSQWTGASVGVRTLEFSGGVPSARIEKFRAYFSTTESFQDYVALLRGNQRYSSALNTGTDTQAFASALQRGGYSTDPAYASKLTAIAQNLDERLSTLKSADARSINPTATIL